ncbi:hypothetical protein ES703_13084 [subsurface metagenome]
MKDQNRTHWTGDPYYCSQVIAEGLEKGDPNNIERGLSVANDLFVDYVLEDRHDYLVSLGRDLNAAYFPHRSKATGLFGETASYLGQIRALINLCDYVTQRSVPESLWQVVSRSKYAKPIMQALQKNGAMLATELCAHAGLPHATQLQRTMQPLVDEGLIRREKFGKNVWYSLTSTGRLTTGKYFGIEDTNIIESVLPPILSKLMAGWQNLNDLADNIRANLPITTLRPLIGSVLSALHGIGIAEEQDGNWRIPSSLFRETPELVDISNYPELMNATHLIEKEYEKIRFDGVSDKKSIDKARSTLDVMSTKVMSSKTEPHALQVRIALERAKCSALDRDWQTAFALMKEAEAVAQTHDIDTGLLDAEFRNVWSYIEAACMEPQLIQVNNCIMRGDYYRIKDALLPIHHFLTSSQRWNSGASLATKLTRIALEMAGAFEESQREYEQIIEEGIRQRQQEEYEKDQAKACFRRWEPAEKIGYRMESARIR